MTAGRRALLATIAAVAACSLGADAALGHGARLPDAEILATDSTTLITDPGDPRLDDRLVSFRRQVKRIARRSGGLPRRSRLLDGMFFSTSLGITTFERSRSFDVDSVSRAELHDIAETVRRRFHQQSVLTFDYAERRPRRAGAIEVAVPGVDPRRLRDGFLADAEVRARLQGASITLGGRLILIAAREDLPVVERFVTEVGGDFGAATVRPGRREFVG